MGGGLGASSPGRAAYTIGLRDVPASSAGIVALLEPLTATLLGVFLFGKRLGAPGHASAAILLAALALLVTRPAPDRLEATRAR